MEPGRQTTGRGNNRSAARACPVLAALLILALSSLCSSGTAQAQSLGGSPPPIIQFGSAYAGGGSDTSITMTFPNATTAGDFIVVCAGVVDANGAPIAVGKPTDSLDTRYNPVNADTSYSQEEAYAGMFLGRVTAGGADSVELTYASGTAAIFGYEISGEGLDQVETTSSSGADEGTPSYGSHVAPYDPIAGSLVISCGGFFTEEGFGAVEPGPGYSLDQSFDGNDAAQHLSGFYGGSTSSQFLFGQPVSSWAEVSGSFLADASASQSTSSTSLTSSTTSTYATSIETVMSTTTVTSTVTATVTTSPSVTSSSSSTALPTNTTTLGTYSSSSSTSQALVSVGSNVSFSSASGEAATINLPALGAVATIAIVLAIVVVLWVRRI